MEHAVNSKVAPVPPPGGDIKLCPDGKYRWAYEFNLYKNPSVLFVLYKIFGAIIAVGVLLMMLGTFGNSWFWEDPIGSLVDDLRGAGLFALFWLVFVTTCYYIYAAMQGGKYCVMFELDDEGIVHKQYGREVKRAQVVGAIDVVAGIVSGHPSTAGIGIASAAHTTTASTFANIRSIKANKRRGIIKLSEPFSKNQVYADGDDFDFVLSYISERCPQARKR